MKIKIVLFLSFAISYIGIHSQTNTNPNQSNEQIKYSKMVEYKNVEEGWARKNDKWFYRGETTMFTPATFTIIETIDSTYLSKAEESNFKKVIQEESSGSYQTSVEGWEWNNGAWFFRGDTVHSFPPSFVKKANVLKKEVVHDNEQITNTVEIEEYYQLENAKWSWDANRRKWLYDSDITDKLPQYKIANSKIVSRNISK